MQEHIWHQTRGNVKFSGILRLRLRAQELEGAERAWDDEKDKLICEPHAWALPIRIISSQTVRRGWGTYCRPNPKITVLGS